MKNKNDIIKYEFNDFCNLPSIINSKIEQSKNGFFCICLNGNEVSNEAFSAYKKLMDDFELAFAFYPYSEAMISVNRAFQFKNPLVEIKLIDGSKIDAVRHINYSVMFFDVSKMPEVKLCTTLKYAFMEQFSDVLASIGAIPSNGMFIDIHESWKLFSKYRRIPIEYNSKFSEEFKTLGIQLDNNTSKLIKHVSKIQRKLFGNEVANFESNESKGLF